MISCSACERAGKRCQAREGISRCAECVRRGFSRCDMGGPMPQDWSSLDNNKEKLERELDEALAKQQEIAACVERIQRQRKFLRKRETEMLRRGLESLDELDAAEEKERLDKERLERDLRERPAVSSPIGWDPSID